MFSYFRTTKKASSKHTELVTRLESLVKEQPPSLLQDDLLRKRLLDAATKLIPEIENSSEASQRVLYTPLELMAAKIGYDLNLFVTLTVAREPMTTKDLATKTEADVYLLERLLKFLSSLSMIQEVDVGLWGPSKLTHSLANQGVAGGVFHNFDNFGPTWLAFPRYLQRTKYRTTSDIKDTAFSQGHGHKMPFFDWLPQNPKGLKEFNMWMTVQRFGQQYWLDVFPFEKEVIDDSVDEKVPLFVDVGGGIGHQCLSLVSEFPNLKGRVILEEQPSVLAGALTTPGVAHVPVDFFVGQPVQGARSYYLRNILHDWPDHKCLEILSHIKSAMAPESKLLLDEMVIPMKGAHKIAMQVDMTMLANFVSEERSEKRWKELLCEAGFKIDSIYTYQAEVGDSIIVATWAGEDVRR